MSGPRCPHCGIMGEFFRPLAEFKHSAACPLHHSGWPEGYRLPPCVVRVRNQRTTVRVQDQFIRLNDLAYHLSGYVVNETLPRATVSRVQVDLLWQQVNPMSPEDEEEWRAALVRRARVAFAVGFNNEKRMQSWICGDEAHY